jgi:hypothetical protein
LEQISMFGSEFTSRLSQSVIKEWIDSGSDGATVFKHACAIGVEGIVAKRRDRPYRSGRCAVKNKVLGPGTIESHGAQQSCRTP